MITRLVLGLARFWFYLESCGYAFVVALRRIYYGRGARNKVALDWSFLGTLAGKVRRFAAGFLHVSKKSIASSYSSVREGLLRIAVRLERRRQSVLRIHNQVSYRAAFQLFEALKYSPYRRSVLRHYERRSQRRALPANDLPGLMAIALEERKPDLCRKFIDAMLIHYPDDFELHKGAAIRCFHFGDYGAAGEIWKRSEDLRAQEITVKELHKHKLRILGPHWFIVIGHIAHLDTYFKNQILTGAEVDHYVAMVPKHIKIHNTYFLDLWRDFFTEEMPRLEPALNLSQIIALTDEFWNIRFAPGETHMFSLAGARVQQAWAQSGRPPLLSLPEADVQECWGVMEKLGVPRASWFACLHVREPGFHADWNKKHPATRDADIDSYDLAIEAVIKRGGYVIRVGDNTMKPVGDRPGFVDYAFSSLKSEMMDVFLCANCRLFIGTNSGLSMVPPVFGKPCALTNWIPIAIQNWFPGDLFIPKLIRSKATGKLLSVEEMFATPAGWQQFAKYFDENDLEVIDNSREELQDVVVEMLERLDGSAEFTHDDKQRQAVFETISIKYTGYLGSPIGREFLKHHEKLLPVVVESGEDR